MIKLYHYSDIDFKGYIKPDFFGSNSYTGNSRRISEVKRAYFYLGPNRREYYLNGAKYLYIAKIKNFDKLYNIFSYKIKCNYQDIYEQAKKQGYKGIYDKSQVILFEAVKIIKKVNG